MIRADTDRDVIVAKTYELRDELSDLNEVVSTVRLATTIFDALPPEKYSTITIQAMNNPNLSLGEVTSMMKAILIKHSQRSVPKRGQKSYRKSRDSGRALTMRGRVANLHCLLS